MTTPAVTFSRRLLHWHRHHGRHDLPWQKRRTPYRVWVSEIMLQQTRVSTVIPYYTTFMQRFPGIRALADADRDEILHLWSGLGYYARARNLHRAAIRIRDEHGGRFPLEIDELMALPGIGRSTAGAILALSRNQRHPILDGNVRRVLARHRGIAGWPGRADISRQLWDIADACTPDTGVAEYTQAIMDLGAVICVRSNPHCSDCPVAGDCIARQLGKQHEFPGKKPHKPMPVKKTVFAILENNNGEIMLQQRPPAGIWGGLWSFPECSLEEDIENWLATRLGYKVKMLRQLAPLRHSFSHYHLDIFPVHIRIDHMNRQGITEAGKRIWFSPGNRHRIGLAAPVKSLLQRLTPEQAGEIHGQNGTLCKTGQGG